MKIQKKKKNFVWGGGVGSRGGGKGVGGGLGSGGSGWM